MVAAPGTLILSWTTAVCSVAVTRSHTVLAALSAEAKRDGRSMLPALVAAVLADAVMELHDLDRIVVVTGPGSFTALRTSLAYAHGLAIARGIPLTGVSLALALRASIPPDPTHITWFAGRDRIGRILLDRGEAGTGMQAFAPRDLPLPATPVLIIGEAAAEAAAHLRDRGAQADPIERATPDILDIIRAAELAVVGAKSGPRPLYVEPPAAIPSAARSRPPPIP